FACSVSYTVCAMNLRGEISFDELNRLYAEEGWTIEEIAAHFGCASTTIRRRMDELGIPARPRGPHVDRGLEHEWSPELAYAVGLIVTDGNLSSDGRHLTMTSADYDLLQTFCNCLGLQVSIGKQGGSFDPTGIIYRVQWGDVRFYNWLLDIGLMPAKSLQLGRLEIPDEYFADFLRGCIDGDGSIVTYDDHYNIFKSEKYVYERLFVSIVSASRPFLEWAQATVDRLVGVRGALLLRNRGPRYAPISTLKYAKHDSIRLLKWMYYSPDVPCLARKRDKALPFLNESN
ncbi:MAG: helix-turn-helix domain-containing protein, partial [Chloroflexota bacterium]